MYTKTFCFIPAFRWNKP